MTAWNILHDVSLNLLILQDGKTVVDQDGRRCGLKVGPEIGWRFEHVNRRHFQTDGLQFSQKVEVHEIFLTEEAGTFAAAIDRGSLINSSHQLVIKLQ